MDELSESPSRSFPSRLKTCTRGEDSGLAVSGQSLWGEKKKDCSPLRSDPSLPSSLLLRLSEVPHQRGTKHRPTRCDAALLCVTNSCPDQTHKHTF